MGSKKDDTKKYKASEVNKKATKKAAKAAKKAKKKKSKLRKIIRIMIILLLLLLIVGSGVIVGAFYGMFGDELTIDKAELVIPYENSTVYDSEGNLIATLSGGTKRKCISLTEMGEYLPKAYVAIEDERFYEHQGVDIKRTAAATFTYITHAGESSFGGSSITQQLVKNITNDKEDSDLAGVVRKVKEMSKAIQVEKYLSKDQILELYLNLIFIGGNDINGVDLGGIYYFNKEPKDLSIAECAFMAGINNSPNAYKPFAEDPEGKNKALINKRTKTVLGKMSELGYITKEQYDAAIAEVDAGLKFQNGDTSPTIEVSYTVEAALQQLLNRIMTEKNMSQSMAETYLYSGGLKIYTTQNSGIQSKLEEVLKQEKYCTTAKTKNKKGEFETSTPTMVIMEPGTGKVVAAATAIGDKENRVTTTKIGYLNVPIKLRKQTGSAMKPIAVIAPGLETGTITAGTVYNDIETTFGGKYKPKNYYTGYKGAMTMRHAIEISANIPHVKALSNIGLEKSIAFCESVGLPKFEDEGLSLALGGLSKGVTVTEMTGAYSTIANNGTYMQPIFYTKVTDKEDNIVLEPEQATAKVMSDQNAYIEKDILTETVVGSSGTATYCKIPGMSVGAKTGTTNDDYDRWLCGITPYYAAVCWYGYETNATVYYNGNPAGKIWAEVMTAIHKDLPNAEFEKPDGIVEVQICRATGLKASSGCGDTYKEIFTESTVPESCDGHTGALICAETGLLACQGCPFAQYKYFGAVPPKERGATWEPSGSTSSAVPTGICTHTASPLEVPVPAQEVSAPAETTTTTPSTTTTQTQSQTQSTKPSTTTQTTQTTQTTKTTTQTQTTTPQTTQTTTPTTETTQTQSTETTTQTTPKTTEETTQTSTETP